MPIFHRGGSSMGRENRSSSKPSIPNKDEGSAVQKIFGKLPTSKTKETNQKK